MAIDPTMALKATLWSSSDYLKSEADIAAYLEICLMESGDDPAFLAYARNVAARATTQSPPTPQPD